MKNIKLFEGFSNEGDSNDPEKLYTSPVSLTLVFGNDQTSYVDNILDALTESGHVKNSKKETLKKETPAISRGKNWSQTKYDIEFTSAYGVYLFGHKQGSLRLD